APDLPGRDHVDGGEGGHAAGVVERHPVADAAAAIVPGDGEAVVAESRHERDEVGGHGALRAVAGGAGAVAVAREIRHDDGEARREPRRDRVPGGAALRIAVEEEQRRPAAGAPNEEPADVGGVKILEHRQGMYDAFAVRNLRVATCAELSEPDPDAEPLAA